MRGYLGSQPQWERGALGSVVIDWGGGGDKVVSDLVVWESKHGKRSVGGQARTFVDMLEADTGVPRDCLPAAIDDRVDWRKKAMGVNWGRPRSSNSRKLVHWRIWSCRNLRPLQPVRQGVWTGSLVRYQQGCECGAFPSPPPLSVLILSSTLWGCISYSCHESLLKNKVSKADTFRKREEADECLASCCNRAAWAVLFCQWSKEIYSNSQCKWNGIHFLLAYWSHDLMWTAYTHSVTVSMQENSLNTRSSFWSPGLCGRISLADNCAVQTVVIVTIRGQTGWFVHRGMTTTPFAASCNTFLNPLAERRKAINVRVSPEYRKGIFYMCPWVRNTRRVIIDFGGKELFVWF